MKAVKIINPLHENFQFFQDFFNKNEIQIFIDISWIHHEKCNQMSTNKPSIIGPAVIDIRPWNFRKMSINFM